jgi:hypothetical protein
MEMASCTRFGNQKDKQTKQKLCASISILRGATVTSVNRSQRQRVHQRRYCAHSARVKKPRMLCVQDKKGWSRSHQTMSIWLSSTSNGITVGRTPAHIASAESITAWSFRIQKAPNIKAFTECDVFWRDSIGIYKPAYMLLLIIVNRTKQFSAKVGSLVMFLVKQAIQPGNVQRWDRDKKSNGCVINHISYTTNKHCRLPRWVQ